MTEIERDFLADGEESADILITHFPLLESRGIRRQPKTVEDLPPELLAQIHDHAVLENGLPYLNSAWASTDRTDTYYTRMVASSLQNFADDATAGISIQNSHRVDEQSLGRTYNGSYKHSRGATPARAEMDFYIPPGLVVNGTSTDHIIQGIRWGTVSDVSVGFYGGNVRCAMCQKPMMRDLMSLMFFRGEDDDADTRDPNGPCYHLPGLEYNVRDKDGKKTGDRNVAVGEIDGAHCAELSFVFDGATPQAKIAGRMVPVFAKAYRMAEMDLLPRDVAFQLENRYRGVRFPELTKTRFYVSGRATWDTSYVNDLPDSAFALVYTDSDGDKQRKLPHHDKSGAVDLPHLRNALARAPQMTGVSDAQRSKAESHLESHAKAEGIGEHGVEEEERMAEEHFTRAKPTKSNPDPDDDGDNDMTESGDKDHSHWNKDGTKKKGAWGDDEDTDSRARREDSPDDEEKKDDDTAPDPSNKKRSPKETVLMTDVEERTNGHSGTEVSPPPLDMRRLLIATGLAPEDFGGDVSLRLQEISREMSDLREWADVGRQARDHLVEEVRKAGIRAYGARSFKEAAFGPILTRGTYKELQMLLEQFDDLGSLRFQAGRGTTDDDESNKKEPAERVKVPARAYRSR